MSWNERIKAARGGAEADPRANCAKNAGVSAHRQTATSRTLIAWEQGDSEPKVTQAIALARALGYHEVSELFSQVDGPQLKPAGDGPAGGIPPAVAAIG